MSTRILTAVATVMLLAVGGTAAQETAREAPGPSDRGQPSDVIVEVAGLTCPFCAYGLEKKFVEAPGVDSVSVGLEEGEVRLWLEAGREMTDAAVRRIVDDAGFTPGEIRRPDPPEADSFRGMRGPSP